MSPCVKKPVNVHYYYHFHFLFNCVGFFSELLNVRQRAQQKLTAATFYRLMPFPLANEHHQSTLTKNY